MLTFEYATIICRHCSYFGQLPLSVTLDNYPNNAVRSEQHTTNKQRCSNVDATTSKLQFCSNVASTLDSKLTSQHIMDILMSTSIQRFHLAEDFYFIHKPFHEAFLCFSDNIKLIFFYKKIIKKVLLVFLYA